MHRRKFVALTGTGIVGSIAGCGGDRGSGSENGGGSESESTGQSIDDHPAAAGLSDLPRQGELGGHVVLAFEDPSCSRCAAFHQGTVPQIKSNIVDSGLGAYVVRTYPVVYPWGEPATQALEATLPRSEDAFWSLLGQYFEAQGQFNTGNVLDQTEAFLNDSTDIDGTAVVADARNEAYNDAVQANIDAAENAGLGRTTPVMLLFRDGQFVTKANGSVSYDLIAEALGVSN